MTKKIRTKWDLSLLFRSEKEAEKSRLRAKKAAENFNAKWEKRVDYLRHPKILKGALIDYEKLIRSYGANSGETFYRELQFSVAQNNPRIKAAVNQSVAVAQKLHNQTLFFVHRIGRIEKSERKKFLSDAGLKEFRHFLESIFDEADYLLSEPEEKILVLKSQVAMENWVKMTEGFLAKEEADIILENGKKEKRPFAELTRFMESIVKKTRDSAGHEMNRILEKWSDVAEAELNSVLEDKKINDELRGYKRPDLERYISDGVETKIADTLSQAVSDAFSLSQEFYKFRAALEGKRELEYWERNITFGNINKQYDFKESIGLIRKVFSRLDPEFAEIFNNFVYNGQIDAFPKKGKVSGAFCSHNRLIDPVFILLNHSNSINDVLTLAHEMGHAINAELTKQKQHALNFGTSYFMAETASTFMEDFALEEIMTEADEETQLALTVEKLKNETSTIFRQVACTNFEHELHAAFRKSGYLSKEAIGEIFQKNMAAYMGRAVKQSVGAENWWVYWSHLRRYFYTYSYAAGLLIAKRLQAKVKENHDYIFGVKKMLSAGCSDYPKAILKSIGVDVSASHFWKEGIAEYEKLLSKAKQLAKKLGKI